MSWKITPATKGSDVYLTDKDGKYVAHVSAAGQDTLRLLSLSPDLLKAARIISGYFPEFEDNPNMETAYVVDELRAIIRKIDNP